MTNDAVVRARIDERTKKEAAAVLGAMGLTLSDAFRLLVKRIAAEERCPSSRWCRMKRPSPPCAKPGRASCRGSRTRRI